MNYKVLITNHPPHQHLAPLAGVAEIIFGPTGGALMPREQILKYAPQLHAIINQGELRVDEELLAAAPNLRIVANVSIGIDNLDLECLNRYGVWATNIPDCFTPAAADYTIGLMLAVVRKIACADRYVRTGRWSIDGFQPGAWEGSSLEGKCLGIVGYGRIGRAVAHRARAFGMRVIYYNRSPRPEPGARTLDELLEQADIVSLHVPLTPETERLIDRDAIQRMKPGAVLLNVSRGKVVDEAAIVDALRSGHLSGAGLDVAEDEPHFHPALLTMENVVLTPHIGGAALESRIEARLLAARNVVNVLQGRAPLTPVNTVAPIDAKRKSIFLCQHLDRRPLRLK